MPIYEYRCDACGSTLEMFQKFSDAPLETCEVCGGQLRKVLHPVAVHFKGSGFYTTDYARSKSFRSSAKEAQGDGKESASGARASRPTRPPVGGRRQRQGRRGGEEEAVELMPSPIALRPSVGSLSGTAVQALMDVSRSPAREPS